MSTSRANTARPTGSRLRRRGFTLVELALSSALLLLLVGSLALALDRAGRSTRQGSAQVELQNQGARALRAVVAGLQRSGFVSDGAGRAFPHLFVDGTPLDASFELHGHAPPAALAGPAAELPAEFHAPSREVVFLQPADLDDDGDALNGLLPDGRPDLDEQGELVWDAAEHAFVVLEGPDGARHLVERVDGLVRRSIARGVDRLECTSSTEDPVGVPLGTLRVRLWLHAVDGQGALHPLRIEQLVRLENG